MITFVTNKRGDSLESIPIITEIINLEYYLEGLYHKDNYIIVDGFETALFINPSCKYINHLISDKLYWFFQEDDYIDTDKNYFSELTNFIFEKILLQELTKINIQVVYDLIQLKDCLNQEILIHSNERNDILYLLVNSKIIYEIDLNYFSYLYDECPKDLLSILNKSKHFNQKEIEDFLSSIKTYEDVKLQFKTEGLVEKKYNKKHFLDFFSLYKRNNDSINQINYLLLIFYSKLTSYRKTDRTEIKINISGLNESNSLIFTPDFINKNYTNSIRNIIEVEKYLSSIEIKNIDFEAAFDMNFPQKGKYIKYTYNGSDSTTGRIYTSTESNTQSLQTLPKTKRHILKAEPNCFLIEVDYKTFEFNLLFQLAGLSIDENKDPHFDLIQHIFSDRQVSKKDLESYRNLGKKINYAFIYGMNIETLVDSIIEEDFNQEIDIEEGNLVFELRDLLKRKILSTEVFEVANTVTDILKPQYNLHTGLILNYFNRYIHVQKPHALLNNYIQSIAADFICFKIRMIIELLKSKKVNLSRNKILLQNHDSVLIQLESKIIESSDIVEDILNIMECSINQLKGFVKFNFGKHWGEI